MANFVIQREGSDVRMSSSNGEDLVMKLKSMGVKGVDKKKTPRELQKGQTYKFTGAGNKEVRVHVS
jgi:hypothetical protein